MDYRYKPGKKKRPGPPPTLGQVPSDETCLRKLISLQYPYFPALSNPRGREIKQGGSGVLESTSKKEVSLLG